MLAKAKLASSITFIVLASFTIVTYDRQNMFIIQAIDQYHKRFCEYKNKLGVFFTSTLIDRDTRKVIRLMT